MACFSKLQGPSKRAQGLAPFVDHDHDHDGDGDHDGVSVIGIVSLRVPIAMGSARKEQMGPTRATETTGKKPPPPRQVGRKERSCEQWRVAPVGRERELRECEMGDCEVGSWTNDDTARHGLVWAGCLPDPSISHFPLPTFHPPIVWAKSVSQNRGGYQK